ncbi:MAG: hypothetical protein QM820_34630 [Minicystis sp.]
MRDSWSSRSTRVLAGALAGLAVAALGCSGEPAEEVRAYPVTEYGYVSGDIPPPHLAWRGMAENGERGIISISEYFDADGSKGINALLVDQSTAWCGACQALATKLAENMHGDWRGRGIHVLTLITQRIDGRPADDQTALVWKRHFGLDGTAVVADPARSFRGTPGESAAPYPYEIVIDPRTMRIVNVDAGFDGVGDFSALLDLAETNAKKK